MSVLTTTDSRSMENVSARPAEEDSPGEARGEEPSGLDQLVRLLALSYSKMPLFP